MFGGFPTFSLPDLPAFNDTLTKLQEDVKHNLEHVSLGDTSTIAEGASHVDDLVEAHCAHQQASKPSLAR